MIPALSIEDLCKTYGKDIVALTGVNLRVKEGDFFALLGPNGAGKSTIIGTVCSLVNKTSGKIYVFDTDIDQEPETAKSYIGLVPQEFNFNQWEQVLDIVLNQAGYYGIDRRTALGRAEVYLTKLGLWEKRYSQARVLSGGMKRRLMIARGLVHEPKLLILDEPTAGVDIELRRSMWEFLREINRKGTTIILTTHYLEEAESLCKSIAIINQGNIIEDTNMKVLLNKLHLETFILDLRSPLRELPEFPEYTVREVDSMTLEVDVSKEASINKLFAQLSQCGIEVLSLRNKANRLEELFLGLVAGNDVTTKSELHKTESTDYKNTSAP